MTPRAPVPHVCRPHRPSSWLERVIERLVGPLLMPLLALWAFMVTIVAVLRPGVNVSVREAAAPSGPLTDTGVWHVAGLTERGPTDAPVTIRNMGDFESSFGTRQPWSTTLYDALDLFFHEGGVKANVIRDIGAAATVGTHVLLDRAGGGGVATLNVNAVNPGPWSADLEVEVRDGVGANTYELFITYQGDLKERSGDLANPTAAVAWSQTSKWVRVTDAASVTAAPNNNPAVAGPVALSAGTDDRAAIDDTVRTATLAKITSGFGPGQISYPGATTDAIHIALIDNAAANNRTAVLDLPDTGDVASMVASVLGTQTAAEPERAGAFGPQVIVPGLTANTVRTVAASGLVAGLMARNDAIGGTSVPAAGSRGQSRFAIGVTHEFTDDDRGTANDAGVNIIRPLFGPITLYGYRTCSTDPQWRSLADQRLRMEIVTAADIIGEDYVFAQLDGQGHTISAYGGALTGMLAGYYVRGALFGATPDEAFSVNVGNAVNTIETQANGELHAVLGLRMSPFAEVVYIEIVKTPITQAL